MKFFINSTKDYHVNDLQSLGWEMTVSNALFQPESPCRSLLAHNLSYGRLLYRFLCANLPMEQIQNIMEIGGGYGYLMSDLLKLKPAQRVTMVDISPFLLAEQKKVLAGYDVKFVLADVAELTEAALGGHDLVILNENIGDFPTAVNVPQELLTETANDISDPDLLKIRTFFARYSFPLPPESSFNFNLGAVEVTEKLCRTEIPFIFISEHSCEPTVPDVYKNTLSLTATKNPARISLKGHSEYSIKFSHLTTIAQYYGYYVKRGPLADFIPLRQDDFLARLPRRRAVAGNEILLHFLEDLYQYEYILLQKFT
jgi:cyclopropane fatty-acyl-phospholipid synthase-like methyltransferase